jgi:endonuclease V-like protein UPF0215 family
MTRPISTVKKEIRILGIDACDSTRIIGVVVRGGLFLDGIMIFEKQSEESARSLGSQIIETRYYPELRAIMIHDPESQIDSRIVEQSTKLPVMVISAHSTYVNEGFTRLTSRKGRLFVRSRLPDSTVEKILDTTWKIGRFPEALRIAHLLAKTMFSKNLTR